MISKQISAKEKRRLRKTKKEATGSSIGTSPKDKNGEINARTNTSVIISFQVVARSVMNHVIMMKSIKTIDFFTRKKSIIVFPLHSFPACKEIGVNES